MEPSTLESGQKMGLDTERDYKYGKMALNMKVTGKMTWLTVKEG